MIMPQHNQHYQITLVFVHLTVINQQQQTNKM